MDSNTGGILSIFAFLFTGAGMIYAAVNHKRIRCKCCGKDMDMSMDVDSTAPAPTEEEPTAEGVPAETVPETLPIVVSNKKKKLPPLPPLPPLPQKKSRVIPYEEETTGDTQK